MGGSVLVPQRPTIVEFQKLVSDHRPLQLLRVERGLRSNVT